MEDNKEYVVCRICGAKRRILTHHISKKHNLTRYEYEQKYNSPVVCEERRIIQINRNIELNEMLRTDPYYIEKMHQIHVSNGKSPKVQEALQNGANRMRATEEWKKKNSERMRARVENPSFQALCTQGKLNSTKFHEQKSEHMKKLCENNWSNSEWKYKQLSKMFDGSKKLYEDLNGNKINLRSSWELQLHNYLVANRISYEYESLRISYIHDNESHTYYPDFYIKDMNLVLEVKPKMYINNSVNQLKKKATVDLGYIFKFVTEDELSDLNSFFCNLLNNGS